MVATSDTYIPDRVDTSRTTRTLHHLTAELLGVLNLIDAEAEADGNNGEISPRLEKMLQAIEAQLPTEIDGYVCVIRELLGYAEECREESNRLAVRAQAWENKATWLKSRILATMLAIGEKKIKTARNTVTVCNNGGKLPLHLPERIESVPEEYLTSRTIIEPDSEKIRRELEAGKDLEFARLGERGVHLRIK